MLSEGEIAYDDAFESMGIGFGFWRIYPEYKDGSIVEKLPEGVKAKKERDMEVRRVKWAKINAVEILDQTDLPIIDKVFGTLHSEQWRKQWADASKT